MSRDTLRSALAIALGLLGLGAVAYLAHEVGPERLLAALRRHAPVAGLVWLLEGGRIAADAASVSALQGHRASTRRLAHASLAAYPALLLLPAGRVGAEVARGAWLRDEVGVERAAAAAAVQQGLPLLLGALVSTPLAALAIATWGPSPLALAIAVQCATAYGLSLPILLAVRAPAVGRLVARVSGRLGATATAVQAEVRQMPWRGAVAWGLASRVCLGAELVLLGRSAGVDRGVVGGLLTFGVHLVGQAVGDLVPGQVGTIDGALAFAAPALGAEAAALVAAALVFHGSQLAWAAVGAAAWLRR